MSEESLYERGRALDDAGRSEEAQAAYREAIAQGDRDASLALAISLTRGGYPEDREEAEAILKQEIDDDIDADPINYANLLAGWPGREEEAERLYRQSIAQGSAEAHHNLAVLLHKLGRNEDAEAEYRQGAAAGDAWAWDGLATLLQEQERLEEAEEAFIAAIQGGYLIAAGVDVASAIYNLGVCVGRQGREQQAMEAYRTAADLRSTLARWKLLTLAREHDPAWADLDIWIGLVDVKPESGNDPFDGAPGAFVNVLALVRDEAEYQQVVIDAMKREIGLTVQDIEDIERFSYRVGELDVDDDVFQQALEVSPASPVAIGTFDVYLSE